MRIKKFGLLLSRKLLYKQSRKHVIKKCFDCNVYFFCSLHYKDTKVTTQAGKQTSVAPLLFTRTSVYTVLHVRAGSCRSATHLKQILLLNYLLMKGLFPNNMLYISLPLRQNPLTPLSAKFLLRYSNTIIFYQTVIFSVLKDLS